MNRVQLFRRLAWGQLLYLLGVIIYGAMVRATLSGAGCGAHWPLCNGQLVPQISQWTTAIEFGHRLTSGLCLPVALWVAWSAFRLRRQFPGAFRCALATVLLVMIEALIGASLVLLEHVADNASRYRALSLSAHLLSSNLLLAFAVLTWHLSGSRPNEISRTGKPLGWLVLAGGVILFTNFSGAFTVLADTLFPSSSIVNSLNDSLLASKHLFVRMRIFHPFIAMASATLVMFSLAQIMKQQPAISPYFRATLGLLLGQALLGLSNILWPASLGLQLFHLLGAELIWICFVVVCAESVR